MPKPRLSVHKIHEILRLRFGALLSERQIALSCGIARSTVADYLRRLQEAGLSWPLPEDLDQGRLEAMLFPEEKQPLARHPLPDWNYIHQELKRKGVTRQLLWEEYRQQHPDGYSRSRFYERYMDWKRTLDPVMHIEHKAGEKLFVDYAGMTVRVVDSRSGEEREAQVFVATLGASNYTYAEATWTQSLPDWIGAHVRAFAFFGGVPRLLVPDNLKSGVTAACHYDPDINATFAHMAEHYGVAVLPTRVRAPKDKAKVEAGVHVVETRVLAPLRNRRFFSLRELNLEIAERIEVLNNTPFQKLSSTRRTLFEELDRPALAPLPSSPYVYTEWIKARAGIDYHVAVHKHYYSVPYTFLRKGLDVSIGEHTVEVFHKGERIASHIRSWRKGGYTTVHDHMPASHRHHAEWSPQRLVDWASKTGTATAELVEHLMATYPHPEHGYRACLGIMRLAKTYGSHRLEAACRRALAVGSYRYQSIKSILHNGLDQAELPVAASRPAIAHANIRGPEYYR
jgi:transposase